MYTPSPPEGPWVQAREDLLGNPNGYRNPQDRVCVPALVTSGGWTESEQFVHALWPPADVLERLFQHRVFRLLLDEGIVCSNVVDEMLQWHPTGFDAFIGHEIEADDQKALDHLAQYLAKGPVALDRLAYDAETPHARYCTTKPHPRHGAFRDFDPRKYPADLTVHIARPYERIVNYHGRFSNRTRGFRTKRSADSRPNDLDAPHSQVNPARKASWARLIKKVYEVDPLVCPCGGRLRPIALIDDPDVIYKILEHCQLLENESDPPAARAPPDDLVYIPFFDSP